MHFNLLTVVVLLSYAGSSMGLSSPCHTDKGNLCGNTRISISGPDAPYSYLVWYSTLMKSIYMLILQIVRSLVDKIPTETYVYIFISAFW